MRKKLSIFFAALALFVIPSLVMAAGSYTEKVKEYPNGSVKVTISCTGSAANGTISDITLSDKTMSKVSGLMLYTVSAYPTSGGTAPDAADVFLLMNGEDLLGSTDGGTTANKGANLIHATLRKTTMPYSHYLSEMYFPVITGQISIRTANQATASANWTYELDFVR